MTLDPKATAALALHRFGLGPRPGSIATIASDPRGALLAEIERPQAGLITADGLMGSAAASRAAFEFRAERQARRIVAQREADKKRAMGMEPDKVADENGAPTGGSAVPNVEQQIFRGEAKARLDAGLNADIGFVERLVCFWSNHFCVSAFKVPNMAGGYEREAIRPHVLGRFAEMLLAVESHPAMLFYLDNSTSIGPNSVAGINRSRGLNENLAREILELHTLGVRTVYTQEDVTRFANVLTGWTIIPFDGNPEHGFRVRVQSAHARARRAVHRRQDLCAVRGGTGQGRARRSRAPSGDGNAHGAQASRGTSSPTIFRHRWSSAWRRIFATPTAISRS